ncbi:MAG: 50S ribosomal protein L11 methyltransferase [Candidatus Promineifilaceae bacterium]
MYWLEVSVITDGEGAEAVSEALRPYAYQDGVVLEQMGDENTPDPDALETAVTVKIYVPEDEDTPALRRRIEEIIYHMGRLYPLPPPTFRQLAEEDWANAWKVHYHPFRIGSRIWIQPSWIEEETALSEEDGKVLDSRQPDDVVLVLDPGMAFGTGLHPTTQMCLRALEEVTQPGMTMLDVGTGSGILAIAAAKMGAVSLLGVDTDEQAVKTALANARQNGVDDQITIRQGTLASVTQKGWDIVAVNILAPVILGLFANDGLMSYVTEGGWLILSGIIEEQGADIETAVARAGGVVTKKYQVGDWVSYLVNWASF